MEEVDVLLRAGRWADAEREATLLLGRIIERVEGGPGEAGFVAYPMAQRAVARAGQGDRDGAQWWWWSALQVEPAVERMDLASFGDVGLAVKDLGAPPAPKAGVTAPHVSWSLTGTGAEILFLFDRASSPGSPPPPVVAGQDSAMSPDAKRSPPIPVVTGVPERMVVPGAKPLPADPTVEVRLGVDPTGRLVRPVLPSAASPAHVAATLELLAGMTVKDAAADTNAIARVTFTEIQANPAVPRPPLSRRARSAALEELEGLVRDGRAAEALEKAAAMLRDLTERGFGATALDGELARTLVLRGRAATLAGDEPLADWSLHEALALSEADAREALGDLGIAPLEDGDAVASVTRISPESGIRPPVLKRRVEPQYPVAARRAREAGEVVVEGIIGTDGSVRFNKLLKTTAGSGITLAALEAVRQWTYEPATLDGKPQAVYLIVRLKFDLR